MKLESKKIIISILSLVFLGSLLLVQWKEVARKAEEAGLTDPHIAVPESSQKCVDCHANNNPGIVDHWKGSTHAKSGVSCYECHASKKGEPDTFSHYGKDIATIVTPMDCGKCHVNESKEFGESHHAHAGKILHSLDNYLAETVEGHRVPFNPHSKTPGFEVTKVNGMASVTSGCRQCHGSKVELLGKDGERISFEELKPDAKGQPTNKEILARILKDENGKPKFHHDSWPNTGIGRLNLDGSLGSCSACHSRHDFSPRRARRPENCGKCHLGPDHPQKEIYEESKHGVAYRDLKEHMNLDSKSWVLGKDYTQAPTCATCHMSGNSKNGGVITHDPRKRISWNNRPPISVRLDTDKNHKIVKELDPKKRSLLIVDSAEDKRNRMKQVCLHCQNTSFVNNFYKQYDDLVILFNEKFSKPGKKIMDALHKTKLLSKENFDEKIEWTWFYLWHHEGRRARHGASMQAPDYTHWHGMYEVADRFYMELIPEAREIAAHARKKGNLISAKLVEDTIKAILSRPEHKWFEKNKNKH